MLIPCVSGTILQTFETTTTSGVIHVEHSGYLCGRFDVSGTATSIGRGSLYIGGPNNYVAGVPYLKPNQFQSVAFCIPIRRNADVGLVLEGDSTLYNCKVLAANYS